MAAQNGSLHTGAAEERASLAPQDGSPQGSWGGRAVCLHLEVPSHPLPAPCHLCAWLSGSWCPLSQDKGSSQPLSSVPGAVILGGGPVEVSPSPHLFFLVLLYFLPLSSLPFPAPSTFCLWWGIAWTFKTGRTGFKP